jgi:hypothetical protein
MLAENRRQLELMKQQVKKYGKPLYLIRRFLTPAIEGVQAQALEGGQPPAPGGERIPEYPHQRRAARVIRHLAWYREYLEYRRG